MPGTANDGREDSSGSVITGESGLAHSGAIVNDQCGYVIVTHLDWLVVVGLSCTRSCCNTRNDVTLSTKNVAQRSESVCVRPTTLKHDVIHLQVDVVIVKIRSLCTHRKLPDYTYKRLTAFRLLQVLLHLLYDVQTNIAKTSH